MKKLIIFDMDGVLFDTIPYAEENYLKRHPGMTSAMYKELHSGNFHEEAKKYSHLKITETEEEKAKREAYYSEQKSKISAFPGMVELLQELHSSGYLLILNTNAFENICMPLLERSGIKPLFDMVATADISTSKIEKFRLIEEKYKVPPSDMLFITDSLGDVREADVAKVPTVAVTWGVHNINFFNGEKHDNLVKIVHTAQELNDYITKN